MFTIIFKKKIKILKKFCRLLSMISEVEFKEFELGR